MLSSDPAPFYYGSWLDPLPALTTTVSGTVPPERHCTFSCHPLLALAFSLCPRGWALRLFTSGHATFSSASLSASCECRTPRLAWVFPLCSTMAFPHLCLALLSPLAFLPTCGCPTSTLGLWFQVQLLPCRSPQLELGVLSLVAAYLPEPLTLT